MEKEKQTIPENQVWDLLNTIRPWIDAKQAYIVDLAKQDMVARLSVAVLLAEAEQTDWARDLLKSIIDAPESGNRSQEQSRLRALVELAHLEMERLAYGAAEEYLWRARNLYPSVGDEEFPREHISLLIAECRFGQGFIQEAIDRAEEIVRKLQEPGVPDELKVRVHQQLGWFYLHKADIPRALQNIRRAMELAPQLDKQLVDAGLEAERQGQFEKALECYFDAIGSK